MIYRILIDDRLDIKRLRATYQLRRGAARHLGKYLPRKHAARVGALEGQIFNKQEQLIEALRGMIGPRRYSVIEAHVQGLIKLSYSEDFLVHVTREWKDQEYRVRTGPGYGFLADVMVERGMEAPEIQNDRARFYFTEKGWQTVGRYVAAEARRLEHHVQVLKHKNPEPSRIVYADRLQLAVLPDKKVKIRRSNQERAAAALLHPERFASVSVYQD